MRETCRLLWDGDCGFCRWAVEWVLRRDREHRFRATPFQDAPSPPMTPELFERCRESVQVIGPDGMRRERGQAVVFILHQLGWKRTARVLSRQPFLLLTDRAYRLIASNRRLLGRFFTGRECSPNGNGLGG